MPNHQARVKMTAELKASHSRTNPVTLAPALNKDSSAAPAGPGLLRGPHKLPDFISSDSSRSSVSTRVAPSHTHRKGYEFAKRTLDIVLGTVLLLIAVPIVALAAIAIRLDTPGSPFFFQTRLGKNGKPFKIFKLRGMYRDARERFPSYYDYSRKRDLEFCFHHEEDPRVTRAGNLLRRTSIDELPNLWNVVLGDMSLIGPRPEIPEVLALYGSYQNEYLSVKPGISCLSKCTGRDRLTKRETIEFDLSYIRKRSFRYDLSIFWRTIRSVILRRDVF